MWTSRSVITGGAPHYGLHLSKVIFLRLSGSLPAGDFGVNLKGRKWDGQEYTALEIARVRRKNDVVALLEEFMANPTQTRHELRVKLGLLDEVAAEVYALIVFLCDGLLQFRPPALITFVPTASVRFSLLHHCQEAAHGTADDALPSCCWFNEAKYSSQRFRGCLQVPCKDSSFSIGVVHRHWLTQGLIIVFCRWGPFFFSFFLFSFFPYYYYYQPLNYSVGALGEITQSQVDAKVCRCARSSLPTSFVKGGPPHVLSSRQFTLRPGWSFKRTLIFFNTTALS